MKQINAYLTDITGFSYGAWALVAAGVSALLCLYFVLAVRSGRVKWRQMLVETGWMALWYFVPLLLSLLTWWPFEQGKALFEPTRPLLLWAVGAVLLIALYCWYFQKRKKRAADKVSATAIRRSAAGSGAAKYCYALLFAGMSVSVAVCVMRLACGDSILHLVVPMAITALALLLFSLTRLHAWYLLATVLLLPYAGLTIDNILTETAYRYTPALALIPLYLSAVLPMAVLAFQKK